MIAFPNVLAFAELFINKKYSSPISQSSVQWFGSSQMSLSRLLFCNFRQWLLDMGYQSKGHPPHERPCPSNLCRFYCLLFFIFLLMRFSISMIFPSIFLGISSVKLFGCHSRESACAWWARKALSSAHQPLRRAPTERQATALSCQNFEESPSAFHAREWPPMMGSEGGGWVCLLSALWCISTANGG